MSEVLLGQSYYLRFDPKLWDAMQPYPPLGTLYAASYLRQRGYDVDLFDAMLAESEDEWATALAAHQPRFAVMYEDNFNYLSKMCLTADARGGVHDDRTPPKRRLRRDRLRLGRHRPARTLFRAPGPTRSSSARAKTRWARLLDHLTGKTDGDPQAHRRRRPGRQQRSDSQARLR